MDGVFLDEGVTSQGASQRVADWAVLGATVSWMGEWQGEWIHQVGRKELWVRLEFCPKHLTLLLQLRHLQKLDLRAQEIVVLTV